MPVQPNSGGSPVQPSPGGSDNDGAVIGGIVSGVLLGIMAAICAVAFFWKRRKNAHEPASKAMEREAAGGALPHASTRDDKSRALASLVRTNRG